MYVYVRSMCACPHVCGDQDIRYPAILFVPYSLEMRSLIEPEARFTASKPQWAFCLPSFQCWGCGLMHDHVWLFMWVLRIQIQTLMLAQQMLSY